MKNKILFGIFFFFGILTWGIGASAETIFTDDFNSYGDGTLNRQGGWSATPSYIVLSNPVKEGAKAILAFNFASSVRAVKSGLLLNDGQITVYVRRFDANQPGVFSLILRESVDDKIEVRGNFGVNGKFQYIDSATGSYIDFGEPFGFEDWYAVQIQWRGSDHFARYSINGGIWTNWAPGIAPWVAGLDTVELQTTNAMMWDAIQEVPIDSKKTPVLIVPGLLGTELKKENELLWVDSQRLLRDIDDEFMDPLSFRSDLKPIDSMVLSASVISSQFAFDYIDSLISEFKNQGYIENETLFTFPYDWRYGISGQYPNNKTNVDLLAEKIQAILRQTGAQKIDVVAHSMGGLITKQHVANHITDNHIRKAVFVGVPNTGAPKSIKTLLEGDNLGSFFVSQQEIKKISENMPAIYDLLPSQQYYNTKGSYVKVIDHGDLLNLFDTTQKDLNYAEFGNFITHDHSLNSQAFSNAVNLHTANFNNFDMRTAGVDVYAIDGCKAGTISTIIENRFKNVFGQSFTDYKAPKFTPGDGTVPLESATNLPINLENKFYSLTGEHSRMMSQDGSRQQIVNLLAGSNLTIDSNLISQDIGECKLNGKAISVFSPIDIFVTDQNGNTLGLADDNSVFNEIPNAAFEIMGEHKFLYLPTDDGQVYDIKIKGTGAGTYTIKTDDIENNEVASSKVFSNLPVTTALTGKVNLGTQTTLTVQENSSSEPQIILPSAALDPAGSQDVLPPVSTVILSGMQGQAGFYRSDVGVTINAADDEAFAAGVLAIYYNIDDSLWQKVPADSETFTITKEGSHAITFFSTDKAGNNEPKKVVQFVIDKTAPEAIIEFDPTAKDLKFSSQEEGIVIIDRDNTIILTDPAGNTTQINLKNQNRKITMLGEIVSIAYNGMPVDVGNNMMTYAWLVDKNKKLTKLSQYVKSNNFSAVAIFDGKNTKITSKDFLGKILKSFSGLKIIKISTNKGDVTWSY